MKSLASFKISAQLLRTLWLQRLPIQMQQIILACKDELPYLASISDKVHEMSGFSETNAVSLPPTDSAAELQRKYNNCVRKCNYLPLVVEKCHTQRNLAFGQYRVSVHRSSGRSLGIVGITSVLVIALARVLPLVIFREQSS
ncbi:hypothetical protein AVEN_140112-1 [Araneus ventricosus]|uniref:Uncharacterized protein n=1 Tax=Araneus ventricosus TaxID=182803 RepID=A0A4Y2LTZ4_ARAVE|nr:hypothetical protein AVEN_140112-1 [Araneus ventricosus]